MPVGVYIASIYLLYGVIVRTVDAFHLLLLALTAAVLVVAVLLADAGISMANCLLVVTLAPMVTVVGYEVLGHRHAAEAIAKEVGDGDWLVGFARPDLVVRHLSKGVPTMPKTTKSGAAKKSELPSTLKKSPAKAQRTFAKTHDSAAEQYGEGERAHRVAFDALKHSFEKVGDHWEPKAEKGPSDSRARKRRAKPEGQVRRRCRRERIEKAPGGDRTPARYSGPHHDEQGRVGFGYQEGESARVSAEPLAARASGRRTSVRSPVQRMS